jgi:signal transduction histidine kinase
LPTGIRNGDPEEIRRAGILLTIVLLGAGIGLFSSVVHLSTGEVARAAFTLGIGLPILFSVVVLHWTGRNDLSAHHLCLVSTLGLVVSPFLASNGIPLFVGLIGVPLVAAAIGGPRVGVVWTVLAVGILVASSSLLPLSPGLRVLSWNTTIIAGFCGLAAVFAERSRERAMRESSAARNRAEHDARTRAEAEQALVRYRDELEERVAERGEQLRASLERLKEQERLVAIGTLASGIAHQINNPIGGIAAAAEFALLVGEEPEGPAIQRRALETALEEARRCGRIVKGVLQFARDEPNLKWPEDLNATVLRAVEQVRQFVADRASTLRLATTRESLHVKMNPIDLEQVVVNLVRNAVESRESGVQIDVRTERLGQEAMLIVSDDGSGIDESIRGRVFEPFYTTRLEAGGSGLGLAVVHGVIGDHGGRVEIESPETGGTRFTIRLPLVPESEAPRGDGCSQPA